MQSVDSNTQPSERVNVDVHFKSNFISIFSILVLPQSAKSTRSTVHSKNEFLYDPISGIPLMIWIIDVLVDSIQL